MPPFPDLVAKNFYRVDDEDCEVIAHGNQIFLLCLTQKQKGQISRILAIEYSQRVLDSDAKGKKKTGGAQLNRGEVIAVVRAETVEGGPVAEFPLRCPMPAILIETNELLERDCDLLRTDPLKGGWAVIMAPKQARHFCQWLASHNVAEKKPQSNEDEK
jgi:hypothetical protein